MIEVRECKVDEIVVAEDRVRKEFDKEKLQKLAKSFKRIGQILPGVCVIVDDKPRLIAGERRLRACKIADVPFRYILRDECSDEMLLEIEIEENINRENLTWQEEVDGVEKLHRLREGQKARGADTQTLSDTGAELDKSHEQVRRDLELAEWAKEFPEIRDARNKTDALKIIKKYKAEVLRRKLFNEISTTEEKGASESGEPVQSENIIINGVSIPKKLLVELDERVKLGTMEQRLSEFPDGFFDLVLFDPPWGVNLGEVSQGSVETDTFDDSPELFDAGLEDWLKLLWTKMSENSHLYLIFGISRHQFVHDTLEKVGFRTNRVPLIWYKQGAHVTRNPEIWPGRSYEPIAFGRKGDKKLITLGSPDVILTSVPSSRIKQSHPSAKHPDLYLELIKRSANPGDKILDPMAGSGMVGVAAEVYRVSKKLDWHLIEKSQTFRDLALMNVIRGYSDLVSKPEAEVESVVGKQYDHLLAVSHEDFHEFTPGSPEWMSFWKAHPERQEEMLDWKKEHDLGGITL